MTRALLAALALAGGVAQPGLALEPPRAARVAMQETTTGASVTLPTGPYADGTLPTEVRDGDLTRTVWQVPQADLTTRQLMDSMRDQLLAEGYAQEFACATRACGGFDFRFALDVADAPAMVVDLGDYRYARFRDADSLVTVLVSRGGAAGYIQMDVLLPAGQGAAGPVLSTRTPAADAPPPVLADSLDARFAASGRSVLDGLAFASGAADLEARDFPALDELAAWLGADPSRRLLLVGHTDNAGGLDGNIALSQRRAEAVARRLTERYGIAPDRIEARGIGYLAPRASNATAEGRQANRRVEAQPLPPAD